MRLRWTLALQTQLSLLTQRRFEGLYPMLLFTSSPKMNSLIKQEGVPSPKMNSFIESLRSGIGGSTRPLLKRELIIIYNWTLSPEFLAVSRPGHHLGRAFSRLEVLVSVTTQLTLDGRSRVMNSKGLHPRQGSSWICLFLVIQQIYSPWYMEEYRFMKS